MMKHLHIIIAVAMLSVALYACGPSEEDAGAPWGAFCNRTEDCAPGLVCKGNVCSKEAADGDSDEPGDGIVDRNDPDVDHTITPDGDTDDDQDGDIDDYEPVDNDPDIDEEEQADFPPQEIHLTFWVYTNPILLHIPVTMRWAPADDPYFGDEYNLEQSDPFNFGVMDTSTGNFVFSAPGYRDFAIHRDAIIDYANSLGRHNLSLEVTLQSSAATPVNASDTPGGSYDFSEYHVATGTGAFSIPRFRVIKNGQTMFQAYGRIIGVGPDGLLYWARYRGNIASADFVTLDADLNVDVIAYESLCYPIYSDTELTPGAIMLMTGCGWRSPTGDGKFSRYRYGSHHIEELGRMYRDPSRAFITLPQGIMVQSSSGSFIYDGENVYSDERWLSHFETFLHNSTVVLSSSVDWNYDPPDYSANAFLLKACPSDGGGQCSTLDRIVQFANTWDYEPDIEDLEYTVYNDGAVLRIPTVIYGDDPDAVGWYEGTQGIWIVSLNSQAQFSAPVFISLEDYSESIPAVDPSGRWLALFSKNDDSNTAHIDVYDSSTGDLVLNIPEVISTIPQYPSAHDPQWESPMVFADSNTLLYFAPTSECSQNYCGDLMAWHPDTGNQQRIEARVRNVITLGDKGILVARACGDQPYCQFETSSLRYRSFLLEHIPSVQQPQQRGETWLALSGQCIHSDTDFSYCRMYRDPLTNGQNDPQMVHLDYRPDTPLFTANFPLSNIIADTADAASISADRQYLYLTMCNRAKTMFTRHAYDIGNPSDLQNFGCSPWLTPIHRTPDMLVDGALVSNSGKFSVIPLDASTTEYRFSGMLYKVESSREHLTYSIKMWTGAGANTHHDLDMSLLMETLEPEETCH